MQDQKWGLFVRKEGNHYSFEVLSDLSPSITTKVSFYGPSILTTQQNIKELKARVMEGVYDNVVVGREHSFIKGPLEFSLTVTIGDLRKVGARFSPEPVFPHR